MIEKLAYSIVEEMLEEKLLDEEQKISYIYLTTLYLEHFITVSTILILGIWSKVFISTFLFLIFFLCLRKFTGGFHCKTFSGCYVMTVLTYIAIVCIVPVMEYHLNVTFLAVLLSICIVLRMGTINHPNICMDNSELEKSKDMARRIVCVEGCVIFMSYVFGVTFVYIGYMSVAVILCATLMIIAKITKQEHSC